MIKRFFMWLLSLVHTPKVNSLGQKAPEPVSHLEKEKISIHDVCRLADEAREAGWREAVFDFKSGRAAKMARDKLMLNHNKVDLIYRAHCVSVRVKL